MREVLHLKGVLRILKLLSFYYLEEVGDVGFDDHLYVGLRREVSVVGGPEFRISHPKWNLDGSIIAW